MKSPPALINPVLVSSSLTAMLPSNSVRIVIPAGPDEDDEDDEDDDEDDDVDDTDDEASDDEASEESEA